VGKKRPRTNRHGTKFFAHKPGVDYSGNEGGLESSHHLGPPYQDERAWGKRMNKPRTARHRPSAKTISASLGGLKETPYYRPRGMTQRLVSDLGGKAVADLLGVSESLPARWVAGKEEPGSVERFQLADLDALVGHLHSAFTPAQAKLWLEGHDPNLGARPVDAYRFAGSAPVLAAGRAQAQGVLSRAEAPAVGERSAGLRTHER
jgi:hypothetical protein